MNAKISGQSTKTNYKNTGSSAGAVYYDAHDLKEFLEDAMERGAEAEQMQFFDMEGHIVTAAEVLDKIDRHHSGLHKGDAKFYCIMLDPSEPEIAAMGSSLTEQLANGQKYVFDVMDAYAKNFHREDIGDRSGLIAYAIPHLYKGEDKKEQIHWHIIVARKDASNKYKLSPLTNHRGTTKGAVKGGFDRVAFDAECERLFDARFGYARKVEESFGYCLAQKKGTLEQKAEQTQRLAEQDRPDLEAAVNAFLNHRVAQLAAEATARAIAEQKAKEEAARLEAARIERANKNSYWNSYNTHYRPLITDAKNICDKTYGIYQKYKAFDKECSKEISEKYDLLRVKRAEMERMEDDIQNASLAEDIVTAVAALISFANPLLGIAIGLVGCIVAESDRKLSIEAKMDIRAEAAAIRDDIDSLKAKQKALRQNKTDALRAYVGAKEEKTELFAEMHKLREELLKPVEVPKPKVTFNFKAALQQTAAPAVQDQANPAAMDMQQSRSTVDVYSILLSAKDKDSLDRALLSEKAVIEPMTDRFGGVSDLKVTLASEGRVANASSLVSAERMRRMLDKWEMLTGEPLAYKQEAQREIQRENQRKLADICAKMDAVSPENAPRIPQKIQFLPGGEIKVSYYNSGRRENQDIMVDANGKMRFNGLILDINTGKYTQLPSQRQEESHGKGIGYGGHGI